MPHIISHHSENREIMVQGTSDVSISKDQVDTTGSWVFGHTQKQSGSILQAGARAILTPSKVTLALSTMKGRMAARTMMAMGVNQQLLNYAAFRPYAMNEVAKRNLPKDVRFPTIVDPAGGYGPQFLWLANSHPNVQCIEIDKPDTIADKRTCLKDITLPTNLKLIGADLETAHIHEILPEQAIHMMIALAAYVPNYVFIQLLTYLKQFMPAGATVIAPFPYASGVANLAQDSLLFRKLAGEPAGMIENTTQIEAIFEQAGYQGVTFYKLSELANEMGKPTPADIEIIAVGCL